MDASDCNISARMTVEKCRHYKLISSPSCIGCEGLYQLPPAGHIQADEPNDCPVVVVRFRDESDQDLYHELLEICEDLETDIVALLHLAAGRKLRRSE